VKVKFDQSFYGREDVDLRNKLEREISGIAVRCMAAYRRLVERGKFKQPESGIELERKALEESDAYTAFVNDTFVIDKVAMVNCAVVKLKFEEWCRERGRFDVLQNAPTSSLLSQRLKEVASLEHLHIHRPHGEPRKYVGLRLKTSDEKWEALNEENQ